MATRRELRVFGIGVGVILTAIGVWRYPSGDVLLPGVLGGAGGLLLLLGTSFREPLGAQGALLPAMPIHPSNETRPTRQATQAQAKQR